MGGWHCNCSDVVQPPARKAHVLCRCARNVVDRFRRIRRAGEFIDPIPSLMAIRKLGIASELERISGSGGDNDAMHRGDARPRHRVAAGDVADARVLFKMTANPAVAESAMYSCESHFD